jgi:hypothetical protein
LRNIFPFTTFLSIVNEILAKFLTNHILILSQIDAPGTTYMKVPEPSSGVARFQNNLNQFKKKVPLSRLGRTSVVQWNGNQTTIRKPDIFVRFSNVQLA